MVQTRNWKLRRRPLWETFCSCRPCSLPSRYVLHLMHEPPSRAMICQDTHCSKRNCLWPDGSACTHVLPYVTLLPNLPGGHPSASLCVGCRGSLGAVQIKGERLYKAARRGEVVERQARPVRIHSFELRRDEQSSRDVHFRVSCSKGTYIRSLAHDLVCTGCALFCALATKHHVSSRCYKGCCEHAAEIVTSKVQQVASSGRYFLTGTLSSAARLWMALVPSDIE